MTKKFFSGSKVSRWFKQKKYVLTGMVGGIAVVAILSMVVAINHMAAAEAPAGSSSIEWAKGSGHLKKDVQAEQKIKQADFLKMVMTIYDAKEQGVYVPQGAENHWAAQYYATAKQEGIIDCGCQIKPNLTLTIEEASKFVVNAINLKSQKAVMKITDVYKWLPDPKDTESPLTNEQAAILVKKLNEVLEEKGLSKK